MIAKKARNMLLDEDRRKKNRNQYTEIFYDTAYKAIKEREGPWCNTCKKPHKEKNCWKKHPEKAPEWLQMKWESQKKGNKDSVNINAAANRAYAF